MQALLETSLEMGEHTGLGLVAGRVVRFASQPGLKVPHTGWNQLWPRAESPLFQGLEPGCYAYFNHSYFCAPQDPADVLWTTDYGLEFASAIQRDNLSGVQFHPEKSQRVGLHILKNFTQMLLTEYLHNFPGNHGLQK
jgi:glutamine amidotransferase